MKHTDHVINEAIVHAEIIHDRYFGDTPATAGRRYHLARGRVVDILPCAGGYCHGGEFDADGPWPVQGDTLYRIEATHDTDDDGIRWSAVRLVSSGGDMRAMVRDHDDPYDYGAALIVKFS